MCLYWLPSPRFSFWLIAYCIFHLWTAHRDPIHYCLRPIIKYLNLVDVESDNCNSRTLSRQNCMDPLRNYIYKLIPKRPRQSPCENWKGSIICLLYPMIETPLFDNLQECKFCQYPKTWSIMTIPLKQLNTFYCQIFCYKLINLVFVVFRFITFLLWQSKQTAVHIYLMLINFKISRVRIDPDLGPRGPDPFLGQFQIRVFYSPRVVFFGNRETSHFWK